jgi:peptide/nickel transport system substrate-binding protein
MKFSLDRAIEMDSYPAWYIGIIDSVDVVDDYTIAIHLKNPYAGFKGQLMQAIACPVSPTAVQKMSEIEFNERPVGTGPFKYTDWVRGERIVLERFDDYWNKDAMAKADKIVYKIYAEASTVTLALKQGEIDIVALGLSPIDWRDLEGKPGITNTPYSRMYLHLLALNLALPESPFYDIRVREAVFRSIDQDEISEIIWHGLNPPLKDSVFLPSLMMKPSWRPYTEEVDIPEAKQLLVDAGYPDGIDVTLWYNAEMFGGETDDLVVLIQNQLAKAGIRIQFEKLEQGAYYQRWRAGEFEFAMGMMAPDWVDPDGVASFIALSGASYTKRVGLSDPEIDALIAEGQTETDPEKREIIYGELQDLLAAHMVYLPMNEVGDYIFYREGITGVEGYYFAQAPWWLLSTD